MFAGVFICAVLITMAFAVGCWNARAETTNATLTIYIVHQEKIEDGRFIDTPSLPRVGYIAAKPDLDVTNLLNVYPQKPADEAIMYDTNGNPTVVPSHGLPALAVVLPPDDAKRFAALTGQAIGKRLLVMVDDKPLTAPKIMQPIEGGNFLIEFRNEADLKKTEDELKKLIR
jgi:preprotein translocase subunit SecD